VLAGTGLVITTSGSSVVAVRDGGTHGSIAWQHRLDATIEVSASVDHKDDVFVTDNRGTAYSFARSGGLRWHRRVGGESYSSSSVTSAGLLYIGDNSGDLNVVRSATGSPVRVLHTGGSGLWAAQVIDGRGDVYVGTQGKSVQGYGPAGQQLFRLPVSGAVDSYPALTADGTLIVGDQAGTVYAIGGAG
jgi:hypothetical protein